MHKPFFTPLLLFSQKNGRAKYVFDNLVYLIWMVKGIYKIESYLLILNSILNINIPSSMISWLKTMYYSIKKYIFLKN